MKLQFHNLQPPVPLTKFSSRLLKLNMSHWPLTNSGGVKQGYLYRITHDALVAIQGSQPETAWPKFVPPPTPKPSNPRYDLDMRAHDTGFDTETLGRWLRAINRKGQAVIFGPPGTGKTYLAERIAKHLVSEGDGFYDLIQFHPS